MCNSLISKPLFCSCNKYIQTGVFPDRLKYAVWYAVFRVFVATLAVSTFLSFNTFQEVGFLILAAIAVVSTFLSSTFQEVGFHIFAALTIVSAFLSFSTFQEVGFNIFFAAFAVVSTLLLIRTSRLGRISCVAFCAAIV